MLPLSHPVNLYAVFTGAFAGIVNVAVVVALYIVLVSLDGTLDAPGAEYDNVMSLLHIAYSVISESVLYDPPAWYDAVVEVADVPHPRNVHPLLVGVYDVKVKASPWYFFCVAGTFPRLPPLALYVTV